MQALNASITTPICKAVRQGDSHASDQMAEELALIHGLPIDCSEALRQRALQNALLWINFRYYLAPDILVCGAYGPIALAGYACLRAYQTWLEWVMRCWGMVRKRYQPDLHPWVTIILHRIRC